MSIINLSNGSSAIKVKVKASQNGLTISGEPVILKQSAAINGDSKKNIEDLNDVVTNNEDTGDTLVYDKSLQRWVAKQLDISNLTGLIDGGTF